MSKSTDQQRIRKAAAMQGVCVRCGERRAWKVASEDAERKSAARMSADQAEAPDKLVGRRFSHADRRIFATVIRHKNGYVMLQTAQGHRISRSISSLLANWIEEDEPSKLSIT